jgi:hypothetical protein
MYPRPFVSLRLAMLLAGLVASADFAHGASKIAIAALGDDAPGGGQFAGPALTSSPSAAGNGWVAFRTRVTNGGTSEQIIGKNMNPATPSTFEVASLGKNAGKWHGQDLGSFKQFLGRPSVSANGDVSFVALLTNSDALPADFLLPQPAGLFLCERKQPANCDLKPILVSRTEIPELGAGQLVDFTIVVNSLEESSSFDLAERTTAVNAAGDVAFTAGTIDEGGRQRAAIFLLSHGGVPVPKVGDGSTFGTRKFFDFGPPALNGSDLLAFRGSLDDGSAGVFLLEAGTITRLVSDTDVFPGGPDDIFQAIDGFGDLVALNEAGDVACSPAGLFDTNGVASTDGEFGTIVVPHGGDAQLVGYPGRDTGGFGLLVGATLGPEGGSKLAPPGLGADGSVYFFSDLTGGFGQAFFRAKPPSYALGLPIIRLGGSDPDPTPVDGFYSAAVSGPATDATGGIAFYTRIVGASTTEALIYRAASGASSDVIVGDPSPSKRGGYIAGPPFGSPLINDSDQVVFKSFVVRGRSALGIFRWSPENPTISTVVATGDTVPLDGDPTIVDLPGDPSLNASGAIAFAAIVDNGTRKRRGIFAIDAQGMRKVVMPDDPVPIEPADTLFTTVAANPVMLPDGSVVFRGSYTLDDPIFGTTREEGLFRADPAGVLTTLARSGQASPSGKPFFRFRDPAANGGMQIAFRAPVGTLDEFGDPNFIPIGLFVVDPQAAITAIAVQDQVLGEGLKISGLTGRPAVDPAGNVAFLAKVGSDEIPTLVRRTAAGTYATIARAGLKGPAGGIYRSLSRPGMASNGHIVFRAGFEQFTGGIGGVFLSSDAGVVPVIQVGESAAAATGGQLSSLNPAVGVNASDHVAFIAGVSDGNTRNALFLGSRTTTVPQAFELKIGSKAGHDRVRGRLLIQLGSIGGGVKAGRDGAHIVFGDSVSTLLTASIGELTKSGKVLVPKGKHDGLKKFVVKVDKHQNVRVAFASTKQDFTFGGFGILVPPFSLRVDVGPNSGAVSIDCDILPSLKVVCPGL